MKKILVFSVRFPDKVSTNNSMFISKAYDYWITTQIGQWCIENDIKIKENELDYMAHTHTYVVNFYIFIPKHLYSEYEQMYTFGLLIGEIDKLGYIIYKGY